MLNWGLFLTIQVFSHYIVNFDKTTTNELKVDSDNPINMTCVIQSTLSNSKFSYFTYKAVFKTDGTNQLNNFALQSHEYLISAIKDHKLVTSFIDDNDLKTHKENTNGKYIRIRLEPNNINNRFEDEISFDDLPQDVIEVNNDKVYIKYGYKIVLDVIAIEIAKNYILDDPSQMLSAKLIILNFDIDITDIVNGDKTIYQTFENDDNNNTFVRYKLEEVNLLV